MSEGRRSLTGMVYVLAAITSWGIYFPFAKVVLAKLSPSVFVVFRFGIGVIVLFILTRRLGRPLTVRRADVGIMVASGLVGIALHQLVQLWGLVHTTATNTGWILTLVPPVTGLLGWIFLRERVSLRQVAGIVIAMVGVLLFVSKGRPATLSLGRNLGDLLVLGSVITWSTYTIMTKSRLHDYDPLPMSTIHMAVGTAVLAAIGGWRIPHEVGVLELSDWIIIVLIGIIPSGIAYYWWNAGLKRLTVVNTSAYLFLEAIVASVAGFAVLGERFTWPMVVGGVFIVAGVWVTQARRQARPRTPAGA
jgi:drug/metabolite transporter (DMT)-like permease